MTYRILIEQANTRNTLNNRVQYRVIDCAPDVFLFGGILARKGMIPHVSPSCKRLSMFSDKPFKVGVFINPTKVLKRFLESKSYG